MGRKRKEVLFTDESVKENYSKGKPVSVKSEYIEQDLTFFLANGKTVKAILATESELLEISKIQGNQKFFEEK